MSQGKFSQGFSLIELVAAAAVVGILSLHLVPAAFETMGKVELERTARMIASDIRYGESKALTEECDLYKIQFFPGNSEYRTFFDRDNPTRYRAVQIPPGVALTAAGFGSSSTRVNFTPRGTVLVGGSVSLTDNHGSWRFVRVAPVTGRVRIERVDD